MWYFLILISFCLFSGLLSLGSDDLPLWGMHLVSFVFGDVTYLISLYHANKAIDLTYSDIVGFVGELHPDRNSDNKHVLYTHKSIDVKYNKDQVSGY